MKKEALVTSILTLLLFVPFSSAQLSSIEIKDINVNENQLRILIQNNFDQDFNKITFIINNQYTIIQEEILSNFTAKFFLINYQTGIKLETLQVIINDNSAKYDFTGQEDTFVINQEVSSQTAAQESNSPISYIYSAGRVAKIQDNNIVYYHSDNIGSTSLQTDNLGNIKTKSNYLPFGKELSFSSIGIEKYGFTSKEYDYESNLNYFNARYYNPSNGKFISNDPIYKVNEGGYQYVRNNPLTITDPSGQQAAADASAVAINNIPPLSLFDDTPVMFATRNRDIAASSSFRAAQADKIGRMALYSLGPTLAVELLASIGFSGGGSSSGGSYGRSAKRPSLTGDEILETTRALITEYGSLKNAHREGTFVGRGQFGVVRRQGRISLKRIMIDPDFMGLDRQEARYETRVVTRLSRYGITPGPAFLFGSFIVKEYVPGRNGAKQSITKENAIDFAYNIGRYDQENPDLPFWDTKITNVIVKRGGKLSFPDPYEYNEEMGPFEVVRYHDLLDFYSGAKWKGEPATLREISDAYDRGLNER